MKTQIAMKASNDLNRKPDDVLARVIGIGQAVRFNFPLHHHAAKESGHDQHGH